MCFKIGTCLVTFIYYEVKVELHVLQNKKNKLQFFSQVFIYFYTTKHFYLHIWQNTGKCLKQFIDLEKRDMSREYFFMTKMKTVYSLNGYLYNDQDLFLI